MYNGFCTTDAKAEELTHGLRQAKHQSNLDVRNELPVYGDEAITTSRREERL